MTSIDAACDAMQWFCQYGNLGYNQADRWDIRPDGSGDCSSAVIYTLRVYGKLPVGNATYTGNMRSEFTRVGWTWLPAEKFTPQRGDVLLNESSHTALMLSDGWDGALAQLSIDENGNISGGADGDQTGYESNTRTYYNYPWDGVLRWERGSSWSGEAPAPAVTETDAQLWLEEDGVPGIATKHRFNQVFGVDPIPDNWDWHAKCAFQTFLNNAVGESHIYNLVGYRALEVDGILGNDTWTVFQFLAWCWVPSAIHLIDPSYSFAEWVDGVAGEDTYATLQYMLNRSYAYSKKLMQQ